MPTTALQAGPPAFGEQLPVTLVGKKSSQGLALAVDPRDDTILFSPLTETAIAAWQPQTNQQRYMLLSFYKDNLVLYLNEDRKNDDTYLFFVTSFALQIIIKLKNSPIFKRFLNKLFFCSLFIYLFIDSNQVEKHTYLEFHANF